MISGLVILCAGALVLIPLESWVHRNLHGAWDFLAEHAWLPMARSAVIVGFLFAIYPSPMLDADLVPAGVRLDVGNVNSLLNWMFIAGIALPLLPAMQKFSALIVPLQTLIGAWLLVGSFEHQTGLSLRGALEPLLWFIALGLASHWLLNALARELHARRRLDALTAYDTLALILLPPLVLIVTRAFRLVPM